MHAYTHVHVHKHTHAPKRTNALPELFDCIKSNFIALAENLGMNSWHVYLKKRGND